MKQAALKSLYALALCHRRQQSMLDGAALTWLAGWRMIVAASATLAHSEHCAQSHSVDSLCN